MTFRTGFAQMFALALLMATACGAPGSHTDPGGSADPDTGDGVSNPRGDGGPGPSASDPGYVEMGVYFATDRDWHVSRGVFTGERGSGSLAFGHTKVSIPNTHEVGSLEAPPWWRLWDRDSPSEFVVLLSIDRFDGLVEFSDSIGKALASATSDEILVFVHGFNTSFADAARRTAQLAYDLRFPGVSVFFSWPSRGEAGEYAADETSVEWSQPHFDRFLQISLSQLGARRVHVIAHSMGSRVLQGKRTESPFTHRPATERFSFRTACTITPEPGARPCLWLASKRSTPPGWRQASLHTPTSETRFWATSIRRSCWNFLPATDSALPRSRVRRVRIGASYREPSGKTPSPLI